MTNTSTVGANNLSYTVESNTTNAAVTINPNGAGNNCTSIAAGSSCVFTASIESGSNPGSFTVLASGTASGSSLKNLWVKAKTTVGIKSDFTAAVNVTIGLVSIPTNSYQLYLLPTNQTLNTSTESQSVLFSVLIESTTTAPLNLTNADGTTLSPSPVLISPTPSSGIYVAGSVATFSVSYLPSAQTGTSTLVASSASCSGNNCSNQASVNFVESGAGILTIAPSNVNLSPSYTTQVYTLTNTGGANISVTLPSVSAPFSLVSNCGNSPFSLAPAPGAGSSCTYTLTYTPGATYGTESFPISYSNGIGGTATTSFSISYTTSANIVINSVSLNPAESAGNGSSSSPFYIESQTNPESLTLTYVNKGYVDAESFTITSGSALIPSGYSIESNNCINAYLESGESTSCSVVLNVTTTTAQTQNLSLAASSLAAAWTDVSGNYTNHAINWDNNGTSQNMVYLAIFSQYTIMAYLSSESNAANQINQIESNSTFYLYYIISGGYPGQSFTFIPILGGNMTSPASSCTVRGGGVTPSCYMPVNSGTDIGNTNVDFGNNNGVTPVPSSANIYVGPAGVVATLSQIAESVVSFNGVANNTNFYIFLNFYGGISGDTQTVTPVLPSGMVAISSPFNCTLTNPSPESCVLEVNSGTAGAGAKSITFSSTVGTVAPLNFNLVTYWTQISGGSNQPGGYGYYGPFGPYNSISPSSLLITDINGYIWSYANESWTQLTSSTAYSNLGGSDVTQASTPNAIVTEQTPADYIWAYTNESWLQLTDASFAPGQVYALSSNSVPNSIFSGFTNSGPVILYHYDGSSWSSPLMGTAPAPLNLCKIVGSPSLESIVLLDSFGAGCTGTTQYTWIYSGGVWTQITQLYESATQPGSDFPNGCTSNCAILNYWSAENNTTTGNQVVGTSYINLANFATPNSIIVTTPDNNELWVWNGSNWTMLSESTSSTKPHAVSAVWGVQTINSMIVTDMANNLWTYTNGTWESLTNGTASASQPESAISVSVNSTPSNLYIVASDNQLWHYNGSWTKITGAAPAPLSVSIIAGSPTANNILVVDNSTPQQLWTYNGYAWNQRTGTSNPNQPQDAGSQGYLWTPGNPTANSIVQFDSSTNIWIGAGFQ
jgi:hypothetical protein